MAMYRTIRAKLDIRGFCVGGIEKQARASAGTDNWLGNHWMYEMRKYFLAYCPQMYLSLSEKEARQLSHPWFIYETTTFKKPDIKARGVLTNPNNYVDRTTQDVPDRMF